MSNLHLLKSANGHLAKVLESGHLLKEIDYVPISQPTTRWKYAFFEPTSSSNPSTPLRIKDSGLTDLKNEWASASWYSSAYYRVSEYATCSFYNYSEYGYYGAMWFAQVCARTYSIPSAYRGKLISSVSVTISSLRLDSGAGRAAIAVFSAASMALPSSYSALISSYVAYATTTGSVRVDTPGMTANAYVMIIAFLENFEGADIDETRRYSSPNVPGGFGQLDAGIARFQIATSADFAFV